MNRYLLFIGDNYYPSGGWDDFAGAFRTLEAAQAKRPSLNQWGEIVDSSTNQIVLVWFNESWREPGDIVKPGA